MKKHRGKTVRCLECGEMFTLQATTYERDDGYLCNRCGDILLDDVNREILGDDADYFEAAGIGDIGYK